MLVARTVQHSVQLLSIYSVTQCVETEYYDAYATYAMQMQAQVLDKGQAWGAYSICPDGPSVHVMGKPDWLTHRAVFQGVH